jgi:transposase
MVDEPMDDARVPKEERRVQAVLALWRGESVQHVSQRYHISRSDLYKFQRRARYALRQALRDQRRGPRHAANRLPPEQEQAVLALCQRHPTWSATDVQRHYVGDAPSRRTIQRLRQRHGLVHLPKRAPATHAAHRLPLATLQQARAILQAKPYLGAERLAWDVQNTTQLSISPSTMTRLKSTLQTMSAPPLLPPPPWRF